MVKHTQTQKPTNCLSMFDHFAGLTRKGLRITKFLVRCNSRIVFIRTTSHCKYIFYTFTFVILKDSF